MRILNLTLSLFCITVACGEKKPLSKNKAALRASSVEESPVQVCRSSGSLALCQESYGLKFNDAKSGQLIFIDLSEIAELNAAAVSKVKHSPDAVKIYVDEQLTSLTDIKAIKVKEGHSYEITSAQRFPSSFALVSAGVAYRARDISALKIADTWQSVAGLGRSASDSSLLSVNSAPFIDVSEISALKTRYKPDTEISVSGVYVRTIEDSAEKQAAVSSPTTESASPAITESQSSATTQDTALATVQTEDCKVPISAALIAKFCLAKVPASYGNFRSFEVGSPNEAYNCVPDTKRFSKGEVCYFLNRY